MLIFIISVLAFVAGAAVSVINFIITKKCLKDEQSLNKSMLVSLLRTGISVVCLIAVLLICKWLKIEMLWPGISVATGLAIPALFMAFFFSKR